ncbi:MAG: TolC family protein [Cyclobacteriaceae bacterium]|nr:TolC family protein [Cyclobacteriaceae bacterium]
MIRNILIILALFLAVRGAAQAPGVTSFTLEEAIQYALQNSVRSKNAILDQRIAKAKVNETVGIGLPQVYGDAGIISNQQLPRFFTTYSGPNGFLGDLSSVPGLQVGDVIAAQNFFQLKNSANASLTVNQLIFNGSYLVGLKAANTYKDLSVKTTERTQEDIIQQVTKAYYAVLINRERTRLFESNIARVDTLLRNTRELNRNGFAESIDVDRVRVTLNNLRTERDKFLNLNELALQILKFQMNYPSDQPIDVLGNIQEVRIDTSMAQYSRNGWDYSQRPDYKVLEVSQRLQELNLKNQYASAVPVIAAYGNLGMSTQSPSISGLFSTNTGINDEGGLGPDKWYGFSSIGLTLSVPIFTGLSRTARIQQEKLKLLQIDNDFVNLRNAIDLEIKQSSLGFENALRTLRSQQENQELASNVARVTKIKYEQGVGSSLEVTDAEDALRQAQTNYYSALFDAMVAKVDLDKAYGRLLPSTYEQNTLIKSGK